MTALGGGGLEMEERETGGRETASFAAKLLLSALGQELGAI
jgi:hypothetical protein